MIFSNNFATAWQLLVLYKYNIPLELFCCSSAAEFNEKPGLEIFSVGDEWFIQPLELNITIKKFLKIVICSF